MDIVLNEQELALLRQESERILNAFTPGEGVPRASIPDRLMRWAPGAVTDVTSKLQEWLFSNLRRFREAHPEGGEFKFRGVEFRRTYLSETNSENYDSEAVDSFRLDGNGEFSFHVYSYNAYYGVDLDEREDVGLDDVIDGIGGSEDGKNVYEVFKRILEPADPAFKCDGAFEHLKPGRYEESFPDHSVVEVKNVLPLHTLLPGRSDFSFDGSTCLLKLYSPNGSVLGTDSVLGLSYREAEPDGYLLEVKDPRDLLGLQEDGTGREVVDRLVSRLRELVFSAENIKALAPCYEAKGLPVPSVSGRETARDDFGFGRFRYTAAAADAWFGKLSPRRGVEWALEQGMKAGAGAGVKAILDSVRAVQGSRERRAAAAGFRSLPEDERIRIMKAAEEASGALNRKAYKGRYVVLQEDNSETASWKAVRAEDVNPGRLQDLSPGAVAGSRLFCETYAAVMNRALGTTSRYILSNGTVTQQSGEEYIEQAMTYLPRNGARVQDTKERADGFAYGSVLSLSFFTDRSVPFIEEAVNAAFTGKEVVMGEDGPRTIPDPVMNFRFGVAGRGAVGFHNMLNTAVELSSVREKVRLFENLAYENGVLDKAVSTVTDTRSLFAGELEEGGISALEVEDNVLEALGRKFPEFVGKEPKNKLQEGEIDTLAANAYDRMYGSPIPMPLAREPFLDSSGEAVKRQLETTGRVEGFIMLDPWNSGETPCLVQESSDPDTFIFLECHLAAGSLNKMLDETGGTISMDIDGTTMRFRLDSKEAGELAFGHTVDVRDQDTGEYVSVAFDIASNSIRPASSFERKMKENLKAKEDEAVKERLRETVGKDRSAGEGTGRGLK